MNNQNLTDAINAINQSAERTNRVTDFFEAVTTGDKSQSVSSPVDGKPIPTVAKQVNDAFNDNSGQLNSLVSQATSQADRAKSEADRASQITGLDTVADAIGLAAAPFPDVWIPFNDSLRMLAGYGREVKVGGDVVAQMVNFERSTTKTYRDKSGVLRTAAINEPAFEKEGLLIEGQSTNLINGSETYQPVVHGGVTAVSKSAVMGFNFVKQINDGSNGGTSPTMSGKFDIKKGDVLTYSAVFKLPADGESAGRFRCRIGYDGGFAFDFSFYNELSNDREVNTETNVITKTQPFADKSLVKVVRTFTAAADYAGAFVQLQSLQVEGVTDVGCHQLEKLPFASSYIPTNGTAVTRAADFLKLIRWGNDNYYNPITIACEIDTSDAFIDNSANSRRGVFSGYPSSGAFEMLVIDPSSKKIAFAYGTTSFTGGGSLPTSADGLTHTVGARFDGVSNSAFTDGIISAPSASSPVFGNDNGDSKNWMLIGYGAGGTTTRHLFGHIRNFRIWHRALSDAQIKGLA